MADGLKTAFTLFNERKSDVICMQETLKTESVKDKWMSEWKDVFIYLKGTSHGLGQATRFSNKIIVITVIESIING